MTSLRSSKSRQLLATCSVLSLALGAAACGGDDDDTSDETPVETTAAPADGDDAAGETDDTAGETDDTAGETDDTAGETDDTAGDAACESPSGSVTISQPLFARGLDPAVNLGSAVAGGTELTALYDTLVRFNPDTGEYEPHIAESWQGNDESTEWTVTLREGVTFGNGDPVTAEAVAYSIERMKEGTASSSGLASQVVEMQVVDDRTVILRLNEPWGTFPYALSEEVGMVVNPAVVDSITPEEFNLEAPPGAGAGPYVLERYAPDEEIVLKAREDYWGGTVCIETLRFVPVSGDEARWEAFQTGELQMTIFTNPVTIAEMIDAGTDHFGVVGGLGRMLTINQADPELQDVRIRQAIAHAIDHETLNQRVYDGAGEAGASMMPPDSPIYGGEGLPYDPELAAQLVEEAKADGWDGTISFVVGDRPDEIEVMLTVEGMLEAVGFGVEAESVPNDEVNRRVIVEQTYQMGLYGPATFEESVVNDMVQFVSGSPSNRVNVADPGLDEAISQVIRATNRDETKVAMEAVQGEWNRVIPAVNLFMVPWYFAVAPNIEGITWTRDVTPMFHDAWLDQ